MGNLKRKMFIVIGLLVALAVSGGTFAYTATSGSVSAGVSTGASSFASVTTTKPSEGFPSSDKYSSTPSWTPVVNTAGSVTAGHLYYIDPVDYTGDLMVTLYLTNVGDLAKGYSYLNLGVNFYKVTGSSGSETWTEETAVTGADPSLNYYLSLTNGYATFVLPAGSTKGVITIDRGSWYNISGTSTYLTPSFFLEVRQA